MFTGIIEETGMVQRIEKSAKSARLHIHASKVLEDARVGDSIAANGVCLTVTTKDKNIFTADVMNETLNRTSLRQLCHGSRVNLERAMPANGRFGGHMVSGHIDGTGVIHRIEKEGNAVWYIIRASAEILHYIVEKGSIAIDGISLTVAGVSNDEFQVSVIPHTVSQTTLGQSKVGDRVNLENDVIGKYIEKLLGAAEESRGISEEYLKKFGYY